MYQDINGKTGLSNLVGNSGKTYFHIKHLSNPERDEMLADGITVYVKPDRPQPTDAQVLVASKDKKRNHVREGLAQFLSVPILDSNSIPWGAGFDSAIKLDAAMRLSATFGGTEVTFFDENNMPHVLAHEEALAVVGLVANSFQMALATKQSLMASIDSAETLEELNLITTPWNQ